MTVWKLAQFTTDRQLQHYVVKQLREAAALSAEDGSLVEFLDKLYSAYPSASVKRSLSKREGG